MPLSIEAAAFSQAAGRTVNEDFAAYEHDARGAGLATFIAAVADGVSTGGGGREAAQTSVLAVIDGFLSAPPTWDTTVALDRVLAAQNAWLHGHNERRRGASGTDDEAPPPTISLCTFTCLVLRGRTLTFAHVGDTRLWRLADGTLQLLTQDHVFPQPDRRHQLTRALGLDDAVRLDFAQAEVQQGDCFLMTTDGVHGSLSPAKLAKLLAEGNAEAASRAVVEAARAAGSTDDATALVLHVRGLDGGRLEDRLGALARLPPLRRLHPGDTVDGLVIEHELADTGLHRLYRARDVATGQPRVLKALHESRASDATERAMLVREAWIGARVTERDARGFAKVHERPGASALYTEFDFHAGRSLEQWIAQARAGGSPATLPDVLRGAAEIASALGRLHRLGVAHRDIKPGNLHLGEDGHWRLLDLGAAITASDSGEQRALHAGTPSYMNPEQWDGAAADTGSDLFALGVTLYQWITGHLPYGEIEPYQVARYQRAPRPLSRLRPDVPMWLDHLVLKAIAADPAQRFETAEELMLALERGAARPLAAPRATPLLARDKLTLWQIGCGLSLLLNAMLILWLLFFPH
jgi:serine/threonine protein phosphatase PrpC